MTIKNGAVYKPGLYLLSIPDQTKCQIPFTNINKTKKAINSIRNGKPGIRATEIQNIRKIISKERKNLNVILNAGNTS
jgi:hypothetical protein